MAEFPALPLFTDALLGDTTHLTQAEFGAYMLMLITAWRAPGCALSSDEVYLSRISRSNVNRNWRQIKGAVLPFWTLGPDGLYRQKRLSSERLRSQQNAENARRAGNASALKRHETRSTAVAAVLQPNGNGTPTPLPLLSSLPSSKTESSTDRPSPELALAPLEKSGARQPAKRGTRLPDDFQPDATSISLCETLAQDWRAILPEFRDYWRSVPGHRGLKLDWQATFRNSCRMISNRGGKSGKSTRHRNGFAQLIADGDL